MQTLQLLSDIDDTRTNIHTLLLAACQQHCSHCGHLTEAIDTPPIVMELKTLLPAPGAGDASQNTEAGDASQNTEAGDASHNTEAGDGSHASEAGDE
jgi:hypothetical protein